MDISLFAISVLVGKTAVVMAFLLILYRLIGKREIAQMNVYDLVTIMAVANAVQNAMTEGRGQLLAGLVTSGTLILGAYLFSRFLVSEPARQQLLLGQPVLLLSDGKPVAETLRRERISFEELKAALRQHGLYEFKQAALAVLEIDGSISVVPKDQVNTNVAAL